MILSGLGFAVLLYQSSKGIEKLFTENKQLRVALSNLKDERQIGFLSVLGQEEREGTLWTTVKFVETNPENRAEKISERIVEIKGNVVFFDSVVIKFAPELVESGEQKALYIARRIYGEKQSPQSATPLNIPGKPLQRYEKTFRMLGPDDEAAFWTEIWLTAHDPSRLKDLGIIAIFGNAIYTQVRPGYLYVYKINASGEIYPEVLEAL